MTIGFVGGIRYFEINKKIIQAFANSEAYSLLYAGKQHPGCDLQMFCTENGIRNVKFLPAYRDNEKPQIYQSINIINSVYGNTTSEVQTALPNKLYDAVLYKKPIIVSRNTYLHEIVEYYNIGLGISLDKNISRNIDDYIANFDQKLFDIGCEIFLEQAYREKKIAMDSIDVFFKAMK